MNSENFIAMGRSYSDFAADRSDERVLVDKIADKSLDAEAYRDTMHALGVKLALGVLPRLNKESVEDVFIVCTVEDADFLARGIIDSLNEHGLGKRIKLFCLWNGKIRHERISVSPVLKQYKEANSSDRVSFIIVKSIISGACVVKTNLTRAISEVDPHQIFVVAPVLLEGAQDRLANEFPSSVSDLFKFVWFATDSQKNGEDVLPGIGGSVYKRLGLGDEKEKNKYVPELVKERRKQFLEMTDQLSK